MEKLDYPRVNMIIDKELYRIIYSFNKSKLKYIRCMKTGAILSLLCDIGLCHDDLVKGTKALEFKSLGAQAPAQIGASEAIVQFSGILWANYWTH